MAAHAIRTVERRRSASSVHRYIDCGIQRLLVADNPDVNSGTGAAIPNDPRKLLVEENGVRRRSALWDLPVLCKYPICTPWQA